MIRSANIYSNTIQIRIKYGVFMTGIKMQAARTKDHQSTNYHRATFALLLKCLSRFLVIHSYCSSSVVKMHLHWFVVAWVIQVTNQYLLPYRLGNNIKLSTWRNGGCASIMCIVLKPSGPVFVNFVNLSINVHKKNFFSFLKTFSCSLQRKIKGYPCHIDAWK